MPNKNVLFVESLVSVNDPRSYEVASNIIEMLDGESLETLEHIEKMITYYMKANAKEDTIHRSLSSILFQNNEKND
ncbi:hypothetical protein [Priestia megaterium]|uniref:hypothetical protein n=1 Tax=Priestia megaterium TaxID=1404 RepID=UPI00211D12D3|nr:hypothetical protein [Priestia megaterium]